MSFELTAMRPFGALVQPWVENCSVVDVPVDQVRELARRHHLV